MTGAIEFLKAWRDYMNTVCKNMESCQECPMRQWCGMEVYDMFCNLSDWDISRIVKAVMTEKRRQDGD